MKKEVILTLMLFLLIGCMPEQHYYITESIPTEISYVKCPNEKEIPMLYEELINSDNETKERFIENKCRFVYNLQIEQTAELK